MDIFLGTLFIIICILLILVVLLQKGRGGGLGAAFGGMGSSAFGTKIGDVFTWVTIVLTALFLLLAVGTTLIFRKVQTVPQPMFDPQPTVFDEERRVKIYVPYADPNNVQIYYTTDGTPPTNRSTRYTEPVIVQPGTTLSAIAYRAGWDTSPVASGRYATKAEAASQPAGSGIPGIPEMTAPSEPNTPAAPADANMPVAPAVP